MAGEDGDSETRRASSEADIKDQAVLPTIVNSRGEGSFVQVPRTSSPNVVLAQAESTHGDSSQAQKQELIEGELENGADGTELRPFDWGAFEHEYRKALTEANKVEDSVLEEFDAFAEAFSIWAQASAQRDNERAVKRLKTRERYVQLSEHALEEKKEHYTQVVGAFKTALDLLKSTSFSSR